MGRYSQQKGATGEQEWAEILCRHGFPAEPVGQSPDCWYHVPDVESSLPIWWEVKRRERVSLPGALRQAIDACDHRTPVVAHRPNRSPWIVTLRAADFLELLKRALPECVAPPD